MHKGTKKKLTLNTPTEGEKKGNGKGALTGIVDVKSRKGITNILMACLREDYE